MKIFDLKTTLSQVTNITFVLPNGGLVPPHFHVTEIGVILKNYIDCGGTIRKEKTATFQLWSAHDYNHRIKPEKILEIIEIAEKSLGLENLEIEVEYQSDTIGKYGLEFNDGKFHLSATQTDCLAKDKCGIPEEIENQTSCCDPTSGCC